MTSFGCTKEIREKGFMPTFKIQGQVYHRIGSLLPVQGEDPKFLQIYFVGSGETKNSLQEAELRCNNIGDVQKELVLELQEFFHQNNRYVNEFQIGLNQLVNNDMKLVIKADRTPLGEHERRYNLPTANEVAVILVGEQYDHRDIVLHRQNNTLQRLSETHRSYDALQYPLIFWKGEDGYNFGIRKTNQQTGKIQENKKISSREFYAYRIMVRNKGSNHILQCRQLFHQYVVDMYAKIEAERLRYIRLNQQKLRADEYIHLKDAVHNDVEAQNIGKMVILPATFTGSPRHLHEYTQDAMTYVRRHGRPDLFITFTCNPSWQEIGTYLFPGQRSTDRHDIIARVFKRKVAKLLEVITKQHVYGEAACWLYTIEWQKRGLPHVHILLWLKEKIMQRFQIMKRMLCCMRLL
jgi:hypothetical protein